jgi:Protein of unknown function (DUF4238)
MKSHTVPHKLLQQFAYHHAPTNSPRLWRYERKLPPYGKASPKTATMIDGHFVDPTNAAKEEELETRLNQEFEQPVHNFIEQLAYRTFWLTILHKRQLTSYISLLFHRSKARRAATAQQVEITVNTYRAILANHEQLAELAATWMLYAMRDGNDLEGGTVQSQHVAAAIEGAIQEQLSPTHLQQSYSETMEWAMSYTDEGLLNGEWNTLHTTPDDPFVIGDAPVVTWERTDRPPLLYGQGFNKPDVEVFLPISPVACLHMLPQVQRTRRVVTPTTLEVNLAQAAFASDFCYTNQLSDTLDAALKPYFGIAKIGTTAFSIRRREYQQTLFEILKDGRRTK